MTEREAFAYQLALKETVREGHRYVCPIGFGRVVYGQTHEQCVRNAVAELV